MPHCVSGTRKLTIQMPVKWGFNHSISSFHVDFYGKLMQVYGEGWESKQWYLSMKVNKEMEKLTNIAQRSIVNKQLCSIFFLHSHGFTLLGTEGFLKESGYNCGQRFDLSNCFMKLTQYGCQKLTSVLVQCRFNGGITQLNRYVKS